MLISNNTALERLVELRRRVLAANDRLQQFYDEAVEDDELEHLSETSIVLGDVEEHLLLKDVEQAEQEYQAGVAELAALQ